MSLINEALRKARQEAAREEAQRRGLTGPGFAQGESPAGGRRWSMTAVAVAGLLIVAAGAAALLLGTRDPRGEPAAEVSAATEMESPADLPPAALAPPEAPPIPAAANAAAESPSQGGAPDHAPARAPARTLETSPSATPGRSERASNAPAASEPGPKSAEDAPTRVTPPPDPRGEEAQAAAPARTPEPAAAPPERSEPAASETAAGSPDAPAPAPEEAQEEALPSYRREAEVAGAGTYRLDGIAWSSERPFALVNGQVVGPGGFVDGARVVEVEPDRVLLALDQRRFVLSLR